MRYAQRQWLVVGVLLLVSAGCATGRALKNAQVAADAEDWDTAVAYYREVYQKSPNRIDVKISLERATRLAAAEHVDRARALEDQQQLAGALAEYRLAADLDPSNTLALTRAITLERQIREQIEAARPPTGIDALREQAALTSPVPQLDPRDLVGVRFAGSVRDVLASIRAITNINVTYDQQLDAQLNRQYEIDVANMSIEDVLNQVLSANTLTFKVIDQNTIFVYQDIPAKRQQWDDVYTQNFFVSHADANEIVQLLNQMVQGAVVRPQVTANKNLNSIQVKATYPVLQAIDSVIRANDKPRAEVMIEAEILEVDRVRMRELGIDLNQYALGLTFSPELAPPNTSGTFPPATPPPFNLNTISQGVSTADFYVTPLTAVIDMLESDSTTKVLARSQIRGREGTQMALRLGDSIPIPQTSFQSSGAGGVNNVPVTSVIYQPVGINLTFTPRVTFQNEIVLDTLGLEKSGLGAFIDIAGQSLPTITIRRADSAMRLRDGEPNMLAGLLREEERNVLRTLPWFSKVPLLRSLFGNNSFSSDQTDVIMIITPRIVRSHEITAEDLQPTYVGTFSNFGLGRAPQLISPGAPPPTGEVGGQQGAGQTGGALPPAQGQAPPTGGETPPVAARAPGVVPIQAVGGDAPPAAGPARVQVTVGGEQQTGGMFTVPVTIAGVTDASTISITITYDPAVVQAASVSPGTFMAQPGGTPGFVPRIDAAGGRVDLALTRTGTGVSGQGLLAGIQFLAVSPGTAQIAITAVMTDSTGQPIAVQTVPATVVVR